MAERFVRIGGGGTKPMDQFHEFHTTFAAGSLGRSFIEDPTMVSMVGPKEPIGADSRCIEVKCTFRPSATRDEIEAYLGFMVDGYFGQGEPGSDIAKILPAESVAFVPTSEFRVPVCGEYFLNNWGRLCQAEPSDKTPGQIYRRIDAKVPSTIETLGSPG